MVDAHVGQMATTIVLWLWFIGWAIALARLDIREHRLPNRMVAICFAGCVLATLVRAVVVAAPGLLAGVELDDLLADAVIVL